MSGHSKSQTNAHSSSINSTNQNQGLIQVLTKLTCKLSAQSATHEQTIIKLLQKIDPAYFEYKFSQQQTYDYEAITKQIVDYYNDKLAQKVKKLFFISLNYTHKFQHIFELVLDLAMNCNEKQKERYISQIINMQDREKEILMPYVDEVMKRKFVQKIHQFHKYADTKQIQHTEIDQLFEIKEQEYQQLRENYEELARANLQLTENHNNLKISFEKLLKENTIIVQEKYQLMNELGVHPSSTFLEIAEKYKRDIKEYEMELERLNKDIEDKNAKLKNKETQIKQFSSSYGNFSALQHEKHDLVMKNKKMEGEIKQLEKRQGNLREQLKNAKILINKLKQHIEEKQQQINNLTKVKIMYKSIKKTHLCFKRNFAERMKEN